MNKPAKFTRKDNSLIKNYDPKEMSFLIWLNDFEYIIDVLGIPDDKKGKFLLNSMAPSARSGIQKKIAPTDPHSLSYEELISHFEQLFGVCQGELAANYRFYKRNQILGENVIHFVTSLKKIAKKAGDSLTDNVIIMKRFINGLKDAVLRRKLHDKTNLTLEDAIFIARQRETEKRKNLLFKNK